jgi:Integrase zinc binding domain/RNase H-like domain found in reverse transcriptase
MAGIETMLWHADILQGVRFRWVTDHKGLTHLLNQKNLSGRQAHWLEKISSFDFEVVYVLGTENVLANALSRLYSYNSPGTVRAHSEYAYLDVVDNDTSALSTVSRELPIPMLVGIEAWIMTLWHPPRPESSREFAKRMASRFVLRGPREQKEGGSTTHSTDPEEVTTDAQLVMNNEEVAIDAERPAMNNKLSIALLGRDDGILDFDSPSKIDGSSDLIEDSQQVLTLFDLTTQSTEGTDIVNEIRHNYDGNSLFKPILKNPTQFRNFEIKEGLIYLKEQGKSLLCIPKIIIEGHSAREIIISEAHSVLAHLGANKTLDYLRDHVWWRDMVSDTRAFCETCQTCRRSKPSNQKPYGLLNPSDIPGYLWESIGIDFVGPMPESSNCNGSFDSITIIICLLTSMVQLVPSRTNYTARQLGELIFEEVINIMAYQRIS